jgi:hypothetical protein
VGASLNAYTKRINSMRILTIIRMIISFLMIVFGAYLYASAPNKNVAKILIIAGIVNFIITHIKWIIAGRNAKKSS